MALADIYQWIGNFFDGQFVSLIIGTLVLFSIMFITWWIYRTLSKRDIFALTKSKTKGVVTWWNHTAYICKYLFVFPLLTFIGFLIFAFSLFVLIRPVDASHQTMVMFIAIVIVSTIRIGAHTHELLAEDLAKLVPLSMLAVVLSHPDIQTIGITQEQTRAFTHLIPSVMKYLVFTIILEGVLRIGGFFTRSFRDDEVDDRTD